MTTTKYKSNHSPNSNARWSLIIKSTVNNNLESNQSSLLKGHYELNMPFLTYFCFQNIKICQKEAAELIKKTFGKVIVYAYSALGNKGI